MHNFFGSSKSTKKPTTDINDTTERVGKRGEAVNQKIQEIEKQLIPLKQQLDKSKSVSEKQRLKQRCVQLLKQKVMNSSRTHSRKCMNNKEILFSINR